MASLLGWNSDDWFRAGAVATSFVAPAVGIPALLAGEAYFTQRDMFEAQNEALGRQYEAQQEQAKIQRNQTRYENALARAEKAREARLRRAEVMGRLAVSEGTNVTAGGASSIQGAALAGIYQADQRFMDYTRSVDIFGEALSRTSQEAAYWGTQANQIGNQANPWASAMQLWNVAGGDITDYATKALGS